MVNNLYNKSNYSDDSFVLIPSLPKFDDNKWAKEYENLSNKEKENVNKNCCQIVINYFKEIEKPYSSIFCFGLTTTIISIAFSGGAVATITCIAATIFAAGKLSSILKEKESFIKDVWECELCSINEAKLAEVARLLKPNEAFNKKVWKRLLIDTHSDTGNGDNFNFNKIYIAKKLWEEGYRLDFPDASTNEITADPEEEIAFNINIEEQNNSEELLIGSEDQIEEIKKEIEVIENQIEELENQAIGDVYLSDDGGIYELPAESEEESLDQDSQEIDLPITISEKSSDPMLQSTLDLVD